MPALTIHHKGRSFAVTKPYRVPLKHYHLVAGSWVYPVTMSKAVLVQFVTNGMYYSIKEDDVAAWT